MTTKVKNFFSSYNFVSKLYLFCLRNTNKPKLKHRQNVSTAALYKTTITCVLVGCGVSCPLALLYKHLIDRASDSNRYTRRATLFPTVYSVSNNVYNRENFNPVADVVEMTQPAVVFIENTSDVVYRGMATTKGGSGFIIREDGLILTNAHVVDRCSRLVVKLQNGVKHTATIQAIDVVSDLATIKIDATNLPTIKFGDSEKVRPGEYVVALGSPLCLTNTVTAGIVSTPKRKSSELGMHGKGIDYIQTDAIINFGNSGGPLVNMDGEAIGINAMKATAGISFAIPSDYIKKFLAKAKTVENRSHDSGTKTFSSAEEKKINKRYIGITMVTLTHTMLQELKIISAGNFPDVKHGVLIQKVVPGGPAAKAGIVHGTIITEINGKNIYSSTDVYNAVNENTALTVKLLRRKYGRENDGYEVKTVVLLPEDVEDTHV